MAKTCDVSNCDKESKKTVSEQKAGAAIKKVGLEINLRPKVRKIHLCADHYRKIKKELKKDREIDRLRY